MNAPKTAPFIFVVWIMVFLLAFIAPRFMAAEGDGFTRGLNRVGAFLLWQLGAAFISINLAIIAQVKMKDSRFMKWLYTSPLLLHLFLVILVLGFVAYSNVNKPSPEGGPLPVTSPTTPAAPVATTAPAATPEQPSIQQKIQTYRGIYKSGFEMNHFYTMEGAGPWWLESSDDIREQLQAFYVERPGRGGGVTVAMTVEAFVEDVDPGFNPVAPVEKKIHVESIDAVRNLSLEEFDRVLNTIQNRE